LENTNLSIRINKTRNGSDVSIDRIDNPDLNSVDELPIPNSVVEDTAIKGMRQLRSTEQPEEIFAFFKSRLPEDGWELKTEQSGWQFYTLGFTRDKHWVLINIMPNFDGGTMVSIEDDTN
jgi:hypothetical protein